jgi:prepilin-type N-terminal cleavage/methylation domain-containing protein
MKKPFNNKGFTLIELVIVLIITGVMMTGGFQLFQTYIKNQNRKVTQDKIDSIVQQIEYFLEENGRLPCVARITAAPANAGFGASIGNANGCPAPGAAPPAPAVLRAGGNSVYIGVVPTRTLNLPDNFMIDGWGNRIFYAITRTQGVNFQSGSGAIHVRDTNNNTLVTPAGSADFVVFSTGENTRGAVNLQGTASTVACPAIALPSNDRENCDGDNIFVTTMMASDGPAANQYDDILKYQRKASHNIVVPAEAVLPMYRTGAVANTCPTGWRKPTPAIPNEGPSGEIVYCEKI